MATELEQRADELRRIISTPSEREQAAAELFRVEAALAEERQQAARAEAQKRMLGITRAHGGLRSAVDKDIERINDLRRELDEAIMTANERYRRLLDLELESRDLATDHGIERPALPRIVPPAEVFKTATLQSGVRLLTLDEEARLLRVHAKQRERA